MVVIDTAKYLILAQHDRNACVGGYKNIIIDWISISSVDNYIFCTIFGNESR